MKPHDYDELVAFEHAVERHVKVLKTLPVWELMESVNDQFRATIEDLLTEIAAEQVMDMGNDDDFT